MNSPHAQLEPTAPSLSASGLASQAVGLGQSVPLEPTVVQTAESKHTPGPWTLGEPINSRNELVYVCVHSGERRLCACSVYGEKGSRDPSPTFTEAEAMANARLIAAAPDLYDVCKRLDDAVGFFVAALPTNHAVAKDLLGLRDAARAAIAKAEGGAA